MRDFRELLEGDRVQVFDGAMGTMLYARGVYINRSFDELNLTSPELVAGVHREYIRAGADIIETNTYGANAVKLAAYGLDAKVREITRRAAGIAREAAGEARKEAIAAVARAHGRPKREVFDAVVAAKPGRP